MPVKDLYYQKYLKYKTKYLNLLSQTGGAPSPIFITEKGDTITINNEEIDGSRPFSVEELQNSNIETTTIKLENLIENYKHIFHILRDQAQAFPNIKKLIFDDNDLSTHANVDLIVFIIRLFENVSHLSFNNCRLNNKTGDYLLKNLPLKQIFTDINLDNNKLSPFIETLANRVKNKPPVSQQRADKVRQITDEMERVLKPIRAVEATIVEQLADIEKKLEFQTNLRLLDIPDEMEKVLEPLRAEKATKVEELADIKKTIEAAKLKFEGNLRFLDDPDDITEKSSIKSKISLYDRAKGERHVADKMLPSQPVKELINTFEKKVKAPATTATTTAIATTADATRDFKDFKHPLIDDDGYIWG
jgi:hypothetical protein